MRKIFILSLFMAASMSLSAQTRGGISADMLQKIQQAQPSSVAEKALANAIASNSIDDLAKNGRALVGLDDHFSVTTPAQSIHNQKSSGRCWMFSGLNVLRSNFALAHKDGRKVEFSHAHLFFWDQLEKSNLMLQGVIDCADKPLDDPRVQFFFRHPVSDGGTFCGVADLADKYGLVPMSVMPESYSANNTSRMGRLVSSKLREYGLELRKMVADKKKPAAINRRKTEMLGVIYRMLSLTLGEPVKEFTYTFRDAKGNPVGETRRFTPKEFYDVTVGHALNGSFIMVMNDPRRPYYKTYEVDFDRHVYDGHNWKYLNLPMEEVAKLAIAALKDGRKLYSSYDAGKQFDRKSGYSTLDNYDYATLFGTSFGMTKAERIATFDSGSTHAMTLSAVDLDSAGKPVKWMVENSWGADSGHKGCVIMTNDWFNEYMFRLVVDKKYVGEKLLRDYDQKPVMVMPEDPLFGVDD
ncbi:peptidase C1-like protein [Segatella baroniae F0067]|uniref:Aminopeptidase n=1 Tax=Segatella baroniae F0067 TaxID=1115809 RepID=U2P433_9BACT|nr:C1 family peptidase [Segatella baroniae]ERK38926.1 peptidase C1-like protein [Segatella baroniae F0067]